MVSLAPAHVADGGDDCHDPDARRDDHFHSEAIAAGQKLRRTFSSNSFLVDHGYDFLRGGRSQSDDFSLLFRLFSFWALKEFITLIRTRAADHKALVLAFLAIPVQYYLVAIDWYGMFIIFIPVYMFLIIPVRLTLSGETAGYVASAAQIQWGLMAFVFGISHMGFLLKLPLTGHSGANGQTLLIFLVFVVEMSDILQYVWGKSLGRHKILAAISPNKTWEGFIGGVGSTVALSLLIRFLTPFTVGETLLVAFLICLSGFLGGAVMSSVKRDFGVKDFGAIIPGHGGMLDRVDSLCYAAPVFFHLPLLSVA